MRILHEAPVPLEIFQDTKPADIIPTLKLDLDNGPVCRVSWFPRTSQLAMVIHHLAIDEVSWHILVEDLREAYAGRLLPPKTTSFKTWSARMGVVAN